MIPGPLVLAVSAGYLAILFAIAILIYGNPAAPGSDGYWVIVRSRLGSLGTIALVAVCQAVAGIARSLGLGLVAEGVESEQQRQFLLEMGVPIGQGFLFAPGLRPDEFARRLGNQATQTDA